VSSKESGRIGVEWMRFWWLSLAGRLVRSQAAVAGEVGESGKINGTGTRVGIAGSVEVGGPPEVGAEEFPQDGAREREKALA
jgi:hypothetical protein